VLLTYVRQRWFHSPEAPDVRDAFLARYPATKYEEITSEVPSLRRWDIGGDVVLSPRSRYSWPNDIRVTGVRAAESKIRRKSAYWHGISTNKTCRPILWWQTIDVFGYLAAHDLPTHPAYAMTTLATQSRELLRVAPLGGIPGGDQRAAWEDAYYGDYLMARRVEIAVLRAAQTYPEPEETVIRRAMSGVGGGCFFQGKPIKAAPSDIAAAIGRMVNAGHLTVDNGTIVRLPELDVPLPGYKCGDLVEYRR
jgi:hypothetical protein